MNRSHTEGGISAVALTGAACARIATGIATIRQHTSPESTGRISNIPITAPSNAAHAALPAWRNTLEISQRLPRRNA